MIQLHFDVKQLKISKTMGILNAIAWNYVKNANMEVFAETVTYRNNKWYVFQVKFQLPQNLPFYSKTCAAGRANNIELLMPALDLVVDSRLNKSIF